MNVLMEREDGIADGGVVGQAEVFLRRPRGRGWMTVPIGENLRVTCITTDEGDVVTENYWMENIDHSPEHFSFAPKDQFAALKYVRSKGLKILANWHSHPASPSRPSQEDLRLANDPTIRYAILSLHEGVHLNSFKILNGEVVDKEVHL